MEHTWHKCDKENCFVCNGGLSWCITCGLAEGQLTTECPGYDVNEFTSCCTYGDLVDFKNGEWIFKKIKVT